MNIVDRKLCKKLFELSGWAGLKDLPRTEEMLMDYFQEALVPGYGGIPQYTLGYLLRKLPDGTAIVKEKLHFGANPERQKYDAMVSGRNLHVAYTPEDAACSLAIELFQQGFLRRE